MNIHDFKNHILGLMKTESWKRTRYEVLSFITTFVGLFIWMAAASPILVAFWTDLTDGIFRIPDVEVIMAVKSAFGGALIRSVGIFVMAKLGLDYRKLTEEYKKSKEQK